MGTVKECCEYLSKKYKNIPITDYKDKLIIPGLNDMHCHASQFKHTGIGMDK
ncbi:hypothetical protein [uncultured Ilyobacter sp.]|uniref:hypothetical protein n=1 Tax=uncultured Ilyobacter sp. TaxID=544433 RepID=UPI0029C03AC5|nr:hypothetical protein [uncultured Ilyobacter sp.]